MAGGSRARWSRASGRAGVLIALSVLIMGMSDCKSTDNAALNQVDIDNYLRGNSTPPDITYQPPDEVAEGDRLQGSVCVKDRDGNPVVGVEWFLSFFADDPGAGSHHSGTLNPEGCMSWFVDVNVLPATLYTSDGDQVWEVEDFSG